MEYLAAPQTRLRTNWLWPLHILLHVITYPLRGDIAYRKYLRHMARQQDLAEASGLFSSLPRRFGEPLPASRYLTQPVRLFRALDTKLRRLFDLQTHRLSFSQAEVADKSTPCTPGRFALSTPSCYLIPVGLMFFRCKIFNAMDLKDFTLYFDIGSGFSNDLSIPLPVKNTVDQEYLVEIPTGCQRLLLGGTTIHEVVNVEPGCLRETNLFHCAWHLCKNQGLPIFSALHVVFERRLPWIRSPRVGGASYAQWLNTQSQLQASDLAQIQYHIESLEARPLLTLITRIDSTGNFLRQTLRSVSNQLYPDWELLLWSSTPLDNDTTDLLEQTCNLDPRIRFISTPETAQKEQIVFTQAQGDFLGFLQCGDLLATHALYLIAEAINQTKTAHLFYSDNDYFDELGLRCEPFFKPAWNYDFFLGTDYLKHIAFFRTSMAKNVCGKSIENSLSGCEFTLSFIEELKEGEIVRVPFVLYHCRRASDPLSKDHRPYNDDRRNAVTRHLARTSQAAEVTVDPVSTDCLQVKRSVEKSEPLVSIIILTRDKVELLRGCVTGLLEKTSYANIELMIVDNDSQDQLTLEYLNNIAHDHRVTVLRRPGEFNFSALNNDAAIHATGEYIGLVNNDVAVIEPQWLTEIVGHLTRPEVGAVGAKLLYADDTVQHAGVVIGLGGIAGHAFRHYPRSSSYRNNRMALSQRVSCVTGACLFTKRVIFEELGGLDEHKLKVAFNDVDYCLKVRARGYAIIWTPFAELYHLESASRGSDLNLDNLERWRGEYAFMKEKWGTTLQTDIYYSPSLTIRDEDLSLAYPSRAVKPWKRSIDANTAGPS
jgi:GT2 family glycosyltransferase